MACSLGFSPPLARNEGRSIIGDPAFGGPGWVAAARIFGHAEGTQMAIGANQDANLRGDVRALAAGRHTARAASGGYQCLITAAHHASILTSMETGAGSDPTNVCVHAGQLWVTLGLPGQLASYEL
jgi:hypothetical protein